MLYLGRRFCAWGVPSVPGALLLCLVQARRHTMQLMLRVQHARHYINNKRAAKGLPYHHR